MRTTIYMSDQTRGKINNLIDAGHATTMTGVIDIAIDRMFQEEIRHKKVEQIPERKSWSLLRNK